MNKSSLLILMGCLALSGCSRHYVLQLNSGAQIDAWGKPKLVNGSYHFKNAQGKENSVSSSRVSEIMPASMARSEKPQPSVKPAKKRHWYFLWLA
ncbi:MAG: YgdI/YgdR family lipoprotein [Verrucomicrobiota bacterium]